MSKFEYLQISFSILPDTDATLSNDANDYLKLASKMVCYQIKFRLILGTMTIGRWYLCLPLTSSVIVSCVCRSGSSQSVSDLDPSLEYSLCHRQSPTRFMLWQILSLKNATLESLNSFVMTKACNNVTYTSYIWPSDRVSVSEESTEFQ